MLPTSLLGSNLRSRTNDSFGRSEEHAYRWQIQPDRCTPRLVRCPARCMRLRRPWRANMEAISLPCRQSCRRGSERTFGLSAANEMGRSPAPRNCARRRSRKIPSEPGELRSRSRSSTIWGASHQASHLFAPPTEASVDQLIPSCFAREGRFGSIAIAASRSD